MAKNPKNKAREVRCNLRLSEREYSRLRAAAKRRGVSPGTYAREAVMTCAIGKLL